MVQFKSNTNANANGELHVQNTRASNNSFYLNYRSTVSMSPSYSFPMILSNEIQPNFLHLISTIWNEMFLWQKQQANPPNAERKRQRQLYITTTHECSSAQNVMSNRIKISALFKSSSLFKS